RPPPFTWSPAQSVATWTHSPAPLVLSKVRGKASHFFMLTRFVQALSNAISSSCIDGSLSDECFQFLEFLLRGRPDGAILQARLMGGVRPADRGNVLSVRLDNVFPCLGTSNHITLVIG